MSKQVTNHLMMVRPVAFFKNQETAANNYYQRDLEMSGEEIQSKAVAEFDAFVSKLRAAGVDVTVIDDSIEPSTPDSIFPNNWISFHESGRVFLYPMFAVNRRLERREDIVDTLAQKFDIQSRDGSMLDWESENLFLEGTGSLILDRKEKLAYAAISERTAPEVLDDFEKRTGYKAVRFSALQTVNGERKPIYHTNVMMFLGEGVAVICLDSIDDADERNMVVRQLEQTGKVVVDITEEQVNNFAGNMLQVCNENGDRFVVMSKAAHDCLTESQRDILSQHGELLYSDLNTIETLGGGSARCMMAEVFLPTK